MNLVQSQNALLLYPIRNPRSLCSNILSVPLLLTWWVLSLNNGADGCPKAALCGAWESVFQLLEGDGIWVPTYYLGSHQLLRWGISWPAVCMCVCACVCVWTTVCTRIWSEAVASRVLMSRYHMNPGADLEQSECLSPAVGGIHLVHLYISSLVDFHFAQPKRVAEWGHWSCLFSCERPEHICDLCGQQCPCAYVVHMCTLCESAYWKYIFSLTTGWTWEGHGEM